MKNRNNRRFGQISKVMCLARTHLKRSKYKNHASGFVYLKARNVVFMHL